MLRPIVSLCIGLLCFGCAGSPDGAGAATGAAILTASSRNSHWPVEGETRPGLWIRFEAVDAPVRATELIDRLRIVVDHGHRTEILTGAAFVPLVGAGDSHQTRYLYTPTSGVLFVTLHLRTASRQSFPDTQRIDLNDDCWNMLSYRVRGADAPGLSAPPPYPRTIFLSAALGPDPPLHLDVTLSGNCFRRPLPPS